MNIISTAISTSFRTINRNLLVITTALAMTGGLGTSLAQTGTTNLSLPEALELAWKQNTDIANAQNTLQNAKADLVAKQTDPSTLIQAMTNAQNSVEIEQVRLNARRLEVQQSVMTAYFNLLEAQHNVELQQAQLALDERNLEIQKAKLTAKNATALDVSRAESTVASSRQTLSDAKLQLPVLSNKLEPLLGMSSNSMVVVKAGMEFSNLGVALAQLESGLDNRVTSVLQAAQQVETNSLSVRLADNDYTAPATLRDAKTNLENSQRSLETSRRTALTNLRDAYRSTLNNIEQVKIKQKDLQNSEDSLEQDQARFKAGQISRYTLQQTEVSLKRAQYSHLQAVHNYHKSLASLSVQAGLNTTSLSVPGVTNLNGAVSK
jgi:outer membrane protein